jgi:diguanylate cyclase (GGDEF)-like protein
VLVIDDDAAMRALAKRWLESKKIHCLEAKNGEEGVTLAAERHEDIDAIVCDVMMPVMDGFATIAELKKNPDTAMIPVIVLTAHANTEGDVVKGVEVGALDHLAKPFSGPVFLAKVNAACTRSRAERGLRKKLILAEETARIDALTGLLNRRSFDQRLREEIAFTKRHKTPFALLLLDVDRFKSVNDTFGHEEGDRVLQHVAAAMRAAIREEDACFRYGGEEFAVILRATDLAGGVRAGDRLLGVLVGRPTLLGPEREVRTITVSGGVALGTDERFDDIVTRADAAMYRAKEAGRARIVGED